MGAVVLCSHGGQALPTVPSPVVFVSGMPITTIAAPYTVAGCAFVPPAGNGPCVTGQWVVGSQFVLSQGQPVAILTGTAGVRANGNSAAAGIGADASFGDLRKTP